MSTKTATKPKVPKKSGNPNKLLVTAVKKVISKNQVLPILESVLLTGKEAVVSDLETTVSVPYEAPVNACVPSNKFLDILDMMDAPVMTQDPPTVFEDKELAPNFGVTFQQGARKVKVLGDNPDNFPRNPMGTDAVKPLGRLSEADMAKLTTALCFVSNDDLRPAITGVYFHDGKIVATDAHRLYYDDLSEPVAREFILPPKAAKILLALGGEWEMEANEEFRKDNDGNVILKQPTKMVERAVQHFYLSPEDKKNGVHPYRGKRKDAEKAYEKRSRWDQNLSFEEWIRDSYDFPQIPPDKKEEVEVPDTTKEPAPFLLPITYISLTRTDGVKVVTRAIDARFPDYKVVIPHDEPNTVVTVNPDELLTELKNASKFANVSTNQVTFCVNGKLSISSQDVDFSFEYQNDIELAEIEHKQGEGFCIAFNAKFLSEIVHKQKDAPVTINLWSPTKCAIINEHFLVMPLMLES